MIRPFRGLVGVVPRLLLRIEAADSRCNRSSASDETSMKGFSAESLAII
jgi:hypothetical protein